MPTRNGRDDAGTSAAAPAPPFIPPKIAQEHMSSATAGAPREPWHTYSRLRFRARGSVPALYAPGDVCRLPVASPPKRRHDGREGRELVSPVVNIHPTDISMLGRMRSLGKRCSTVPFLLVSAASFVPITPYFWWFVRHALDED
ncbi:hypothetical protein MAPG_03468 [Magnaporthiopsis poae ATCC 64411]|uniref:Uncharacterized protein n=1 Tax=Magnaporthiopsis poae (strain ATCC 64411 / 73-15) TaxID=644358 RepID=A0A0C4DU34_MAGP6|nr:hypothetical protein MAPG_03468 [Magnaporthiopsis poae ATCC 64411]